MKAALPFLLVAAGCAANTGVVPTGGDSYMVAKQAASGFSGLGTLKADALTEAGQYCKVRGRSMQVLNATETQPPYALGNYPRAEVQFACVAK